MIGIDIVSLSRFEKVISETPKVLDIILHESEKEISIEPQFVAGRFAAKEALLKCGIGLRNTFQFAEIEIFVEQDLGISTKWNGELVDAALSLSHDENFVVAVAINQQAKLSEPGI